MSETPFRERACIPKATRQGLRSFRSQSPATQHPSKFADCCLRTKRYSQFLDFIGARPELGSAFLPFPCPTLANGDFCCQRCLFLSLHLRCSFTEVTEYVLSRVPLCGMGVVRPCATVFARMVSAACSNGAVHLNQHLGGVMWLMCWLMRSRRPIFTAASLEKEDGDIALRCEA